MADRSSPPMSLNSTDYTKIRKDALWFLLVPLTFYIIAILAIIQKEDHVLHLADFIPSNETTITIVAWVLNQILNSFRKFIA